MTRLFVPLMTAWFEAFTSGRKTYELRGYGRQYTEKNVYPGKEVELRKGYSGASLHGTIGEVVIGSLDDILEQVPYRAIMPDARTRSEVKENAQALLANNEKYIAFEIKNIKKEK
ncbi:MAG: hypothetical protein V1725_02330 [archaeon]